MNLDRYAVREGSTLDGYAGRMDLGEWNDWWKYFGIAPVKHILLLYWDPIGVYGVKEAHDEYDSYVGGVGAILRTGASEHQIADYLDRMASERMGLGSQGARPAHRIMEWFADAMRAFGEDPDLPVKGSS